MTLALAYDIDAIADNAKLAARRLAEAAAAQQHAVHVDDRVPRAQGQSQRHQGLGRPGEARRRGDHAESRRPRAARAGTTSPRGATRRAQVRRRGEGEGVRRAALRERAGARFRRARLDDDVRRARHRRRADRLGERGVSRGEGARARTSSRSSCRRVSILAEPPVAVVDKVVDKKRHAQGRRRPTSNISIRAEGQEIAARNYYRPDARRRSRRSTPSSSRRSTLFTLDGASSAAGRTAQKTHFADGGTFDQIYKPGAQ